MEAILLVGGLGTRLRPLTENLPKPMLPVAGVPLVVHQIARLKAAGIDHVVLATSYKADVFSEALGDGSHLGVRVDYAVETEPLGTGGAIRHAADLLDDRAGPVLICNGDVIDAHAIRAQVSQHVEAGAAATLYLTRVDDASAYGCVPTEPDGRVTAFLEKMDAPVTSQVNAGCYVFERSVIATIPAGKPVSVERETFPSVLDSGALMLGVVDDAYWRDLGTPESYIQGSADVVLGLVDSPARPGPAGPHLVLDGAKVHDDARLSGGTCIGPGTVVHEGAEVHGSVVLDDVTVGAGAAVRASALGRGVVVGEGVHLDGVVVADGVTVPAGARPEPGTRLTA